MDTLPYYVVWVNLLSEMGESKFYPVNKGDIDDLDSLKLQCREIGDGKTYTVTESKDKNSVTGRVLEVDIVERSTQKLVYTYEDGRGYIYVTKGNQKGVKIPEEREERLATSEDKKKAVEPISTGVSPSEPDNVVTSEPLDTDEAVLDSLFLKVSQPVKGYETIYEKIAHKKMERLLENI